MNNKISPLAASLTAAIVSALLMLVLGIFGNIGIYESAVESMQRWHMFFDLSVVGIIGGMIEAAVIAFVIVIISVWIYNMLVGKLNK